MRALEGGCGIIILAAAILLGCALAFDTLIALTS